MRETPKPRSNPTPSLMQEVIPSLVRMLHRPLRAVVSQLFTAEERGNMQALVSMLITYNFNFDLAPLEAASDDAPLMLKPEIHTVCTFPVCHSSLSEGLASSLLALARQSSSALLT